MSNVANPLTPVAYVLGAIELRIDGVLSFENQTVHLPPKELCVLRVLLECSGQIVSKDRLMQHAWPGGDICEESLTRCIYSLRKCLGLYRHYVVTVYGKGYRLACNVERLPSTVSASEPVVRRSLLARRLLPGLFRKARAHRLRPLTCKSRAAGRWCIHYSLHCAAPLPGMRMVSKSGVGFSVLGIFKS